MSIEDDATELWCRGVRIVDERQGEPPLVWTPWDPRPMTLGAALVRLHEEHARAVFHRLATERVTENTCNPEEDNRGR